MLVTLVSFCYIGMTACLWGALLWKLFFGKKTKHAFRLDETIMAGLVGLTVYAQFFSLFYKVGLLANLILLAVCVVSLFVCKKELWQLAKQGSRQKKCLWLFLLLLFAYGASTGYIHYDTGLYHAQAIRWIEELGIVKGLGNLHCRLAYNSAAFPLTALFSFSFLGGQSLHTVSGVMACLLAWVCSDVWKIAQRKKVLLSDLVKITGIYYLLIIFDEMISPASDYFMVLTVFYLVIKWTELLERRDTEATGYALLSVLAVFAVSIKLSAVCVVLLALKPAVMLIKEKRGKDIGKYLAAGFTVILPYLLRNIIISGWLIYPFTALDFFKVDWKIPKALAEYDSREIKVWGRGYTDVAAYDRSFFQWFPDWFREQGRLDQLFVLGSLLAALVLLGIIIYTLCNRNKKYLDYIFLDSCLVGCFFFWLLSAPLIRYGCVFLWLPAVMILGQTAGWLYGRLCCFGEISKKQNVIVICKGIRSMGYILLVLLALYKSVTFGREMAAGASSRYLVCQKDYEAFETIEYEIEGMPFYYAAQGDRTGYEPFPSSPAKAAVKLRGTTLKTGFQYKE